MSMFSWFKKKKNEKEVIQDTSSEENLQKEVVVHEECIKIREFGEWLDHLLCGDYYIAKSEYGNRISEEKATVTFFDTLKKSGMLREFCNQNQEDYNEIEKILDQYHTIETVVKKHNEEFICKHLREDKQYLDDILKDVDDEICLDEDQRRVVLTDEDHCLVVAGAGAGKTTTVAAKVKYLVEKQGVLPEEILVISFTNKAVKELRDRINQELNIPCPIATFHSTGNAILRKESPEPLNIVQPSKIYYVLQDYFQNSIMKNESMVNNLILFFASYFDAPYEGEDLNRFFNEIAKSNFSTMRSDLDEYKKEIVDSRTKRKVTILNEVLRSYQEVEIANFLYLNSIDYEYEPLYQYYIPKARKPYTPDFIIRQGEHKAYIEHFGITQDGHNDRFSDDELENYKKAINDKIMLHKRHGTTLIYTFSSYLDHRSLLEHLQEELEKFGFQLKPRSNKEIMEKMVSSEGNRYIRRLVDLVCRFIRNFKTCGFSEEDFWKMSHSTENVRSKLFLHICNDCYLTYEKYLKENDAVDFEDMINHSAKVLRDVKEMKQKLSFKYIIVDEYQDISRQRFDLVTALSDVTDAKIVAVGDDWQSIYAFSGSDITLFTKFEEKMGYAQMLKIVNTYRNSQEVIDIAGNFIQKNTSQITKALKSYKNIQDPVIIYTYDGTPKKVWGRKNSGANYELAHAVEKILEQIIEFNEKESKPRDSSILLLGRFGFDGDLLEKSGLFEYVKKGNKLRSVKYPYLNISFMTAHASKGLGYDNVIIINGKNETYGFPSKIQDDPVLSFVIQDDSSYEYAEERRLFYVAMTRTKNRVFCVAPEKNPSEFLLELKRDYKNVVLRGTWSEEGLQNNLAKKVCPRCGYPLQLKYKSSYGLRLWICTNEPELCGFMTNEYGAGKLSILKCDKCQDGYLIVKKAKNGEYFLGCTNYQSDGKGCDRTMSQEQFYNIFHLSQDFDKKKAERSYEQRKTMMKSPGKTDEKASKKISEKTRDLSYDQTEKEEHVIHKAKIEKIQYRSYDLSEVVYIVLNGLTHVSQKKYYGITMLTDVLRGAQTDRILKLNFTEIPEYGKLRRMSRDDVSEIIKWLIKNHYILQTQNSKYPVLHETYEGIHYQDTLTKGKLKKLKEYLEGTEDKDS